MTTTESYGCDKHGEDAYQGCAMCDLEALRERLHEAELVAASWKREAELNEQAANESSGYAKRLAEAERRLKNYEPTNLYNGLTIEQWKARAENAEAALVAEVAKNGRHAMRVTIAQLAARLQKVMARCADLLDEDQFNELDAIASSASGVQHKPCEICTTQSWCETHGCQCYPTEAMCCVDYPRCDCNSPPEPDDEWHCSQYPGCECFTGCREKALEAAP